MDSIENIHAEEASKPVSWLQFLLLIALGLVSAFSPYVITIVWVALAGFTLYPLINGKIEWTWYGLLASPMLEVWARMTKAPFLPYECGKYYLLLSILVLLIYHVKHKSDEPVHRGGLPILFLIAPSSIVAIDTFDREQWVFNLLPIVALGGLLLFAAREKWDIDRFGKTLRFGLLPVIPILVYLTIRTPSVTALSFTLGANLEATGAFGSNQVSTVLGNAIVLTVILLLFKYPLFPLRWLSYALIAYLVLRGLLTFSRGGMLGAVFSVIIAILPAMFASITSFIRSMALILIFSIVGYGVFTVVNDLSGNKLLQRYMGETGGTLSGQREKTLNIATSGRLYIVKADWEIFKKNFWFGVGPGGAKELRGDYGAIEDSAAHTEFTRLLSEHGIGGLLVVITLVFFPLAWIKKQRFRLWRSVLTALFFLAIFTSTHSAMRTNTTVVYYVLAAVPVVMSPYWYHKFSSID